MSRRQVGPGKWVLEEPRKPYPGARQMMGGPIVDVGKGKGLSVPTPAEVERRRRSAERAKP